MKQLISYAIRLVFISLFFVACSNNNNNSDAEMARLTTEIDRIQKENEDLRKAKGNTGIISEPAKSDYDNSFLANFCSLVRVDITEDELKPYLKEGIDPAPLKKALVKSSKLVKNCEFKTMKLYDHPFDVAEYKVDDGYVYVQATYNSEFKIDSFIPLIFKFPLNIQLHKVKARDGVELTTYVVHRADDTTPKGSFFLRTPYMVYGFYLSYSMLALASNKVFVLQANRGSHTSQGQFKWLDKVNINDSADTLDWLAQQPISNGKVVAYGVSYDGYNALATASTNHPSLKSVISCSSPANAATDSLTSNRFIENGIFGYVTTDRKTETLQQSSNFIPFIDTETHTQIRQKLDDVLIGFDFEEWNITSAAIDDKDHSYWKERQLLDELSVTPVPIVHIAGLKFDQDGRDTILAHDHIQKTSASKDKNFLVLHKYGHGCGDSYRLNIYKKMIQLTDSDARDIDLSVEPKYSLYTFTKNDYVFANTKEELPIENKIFPLVEDLDILDYGYLTVDDPEQYNKSIVIPITERLLLNGVPTMKLYYKATAPEVPVHVYFGVFNMFNQNLTFGWRTGFITNKIDEVSSVDLTFPLVNTAVPAGARLIVYISTNDSRTFYRQPQTRTKFKPLQSPSVTLLQGEGQQSTFSFPIEKIAN